MTFMPATQPVTTIAPYAFDEGNLLSGDTRAFRPWFENGAWQGDIIEYNVDASGVRSFPARIAAAQRRVASIRSASQDRADSAVTRRVGNGGWSASSGGTIGG